MEDKAYKNLAKMMEADPDTKKTLSHMNLASELAESIGYPINSLGELITKISNKSINVGNRTMETEDLQRIIPVYYFPITSKENFTEKANSLIIKDLKRRVRNISTNTL